MFRITKNFDDWLKVMMVRGIVFIGEQKTSYAIEKDEFEFSSLHILGEINGEPIAAGRLRFPGAYAKLERIAVRKEYRSKGLGHKLVDFMIETAFEKGFKKMKLHAQVYLEKFYESHGFKSVGNTFMEADIEHILMIRDD